MNEFEASDRLLTFWFPSLFMFGWFQAAMWSCGSGYKARVVAIQQSLY